MAGNQAWYGAKILIQLQCRVTTPLWELGADSGQREKKNEIGGKIQTENDCSARPWGRRSVTLLSESCITVDYTGHSASVLRDSAVYLRKNICLIMTKGLFMGFPGETKSRLS